MMDNCSHGQEGRTDSREGLSRTRGIRRPTYRARKAAHQSCCMFRTNTGKAPQSEKCPLDEDENMRDVGQVGS